MRTAMVTANWRGCVVDRAGDCAALGERVGTERGMTLLSPWAKSDPWRRGRPLSAIFLLSARGDGLDLCRSRFGLLT